MEDSEVLTEDSGKSVDPLAERMEHRRWKWLDCLELSSAKKYTVFVFEIDCKEAGSHQKELK